LIDRLTAALKRSRADYTEIRVERTWSTAVTVRGSDASGNTGAGFWAETAPAELNLSASTAASNQTGVRSTDSAIVRLTAVALTGNTSAGLLAETGGQLVPFTENQIAGNPPGAGGTPSCEVAAAAATVVCPASACPQPVCQAPIVQSMVGPCRRCRTKHGVTSCSNCGVSIR